MDLPQLFSIIMNLSTLVFVVTNMLAMGLSLSVAQRAGSRKLSARCSDWEPPSAICRQPWSWLQPILLKTQR